MTIIDHGNVTNSLFTKQTLLYLFYQKLIFATSLFIITLSFIFYGYTKATIYEEIKEQLLADAKLIYKLSLNSQVKKTNFNIITNQDISVDLITIKNLNSITYKRYQEGDDFYVELLFPFDLTNSKFIKITKNIKSQSYHEKKMIKSLSFKGIKNAFNEETN